MIKTFSLLTPKITFIKPTDTRTVFHVSLFRRFDWAFLESLRVHRIAFITSSAVHSRSADGNLDDDEDDVVIKI